MLFDTRYPRTLGTCFSQKSAYLSKIAALKFDVFFHVCCYPALKKKVKKQKKYPITPLLSV